MRNTETGGDSKKQIDKKRHSVKTTEVLWSGSMTLMRPIIALDGGRRSWGAEMGVDDQRRDTERESAASTQAYTMPKHTLHTADDEIRKKKFGDYTKRERERKIGKKSRWVWSKVDFYTLFYLLGVFLAFTFGWVVNTFFCGVTNSEHI